jgi:putative hydrolase of the HAD superfamily
MSKTKAILFDLGNVLFEIDIPRCSQNIYDLLDPNLDRGIFRSTFKQKNDALETGELSKGAFVNFILRHSRKGVQALDVILAWNSMLIGMPEGHFDLLRRLRKDYKVYLLSNINPFHLVRFKEMIVEDHGITNFDDYFDQTFYSHLIRARKPMREAFDHVVKETGVAPAEMLFLDDTLDNVNSARAVGIRSAHVPEFHMMTSILDSQL